MNPEDAQSARLAFALSEIERLRERNHEFGNKIIEHNGHIEDAREDIKDLRREMNRRFKDQNEKIDKRFDSLSGSMWRVAGLLVTGMGVAAAIVAVIVS